MVGAHKMKWPYPTLFLLAMFYNFTEAKKGNKQERHKSLKLMNGIACKYS